MPEYDSERPRSEAQRQHEAKRRGGVTSKTAATPKTLTPDEQAKARSGLLGKPLQPDQVV